MTERIVTDADELRRLHSELESIKQAITDPENQPSQFGTVTVEYMQREIEAERERIFGVLLDMHDKTQGTHNYYLHAIIHIKTRSNKWLK